MTVSLRPVTSEDREFLYRVYAGSRMEELAPLPWSDEQLQGFLRMQFAAQDEDYRKRCPAASFDLIVRDDNAIGRLYVDRRDDEIRILDISLLPDYRNQGVGTPLIRELMNEAGASGRAVRIWVESYNRSRGLFERLGFGLVEEDGPLHFMEWTSKPEDPAQKEPEGKDSFPVNR